MARTEEDSRRWVEEGTALFERALAGRTDPRSFLDVALGERTRAETAAVVRGAAERWEGIALAMASPEFNRR